MSRQSLNGRSRRSRRKLLWEVQHGFCFYCRKFVELEKATLEHIQPRAHGGKNAWPNLAMACLDCNSGLQNMHNWYESDLKYGKAFRPILWYLWKEQKADRPGWRKLCRKADNVCFHLLRNVRSGPVGSNEEAHKLRQYFSRL